MKKITTKPAVITAAFSFALGLGIVRFGYIFKAFYLNLKSKGITPSSDDEKKFPSRTVKEGVHKHWKMAGETERIQLSQRFIENLSSTDASSFLVVKDDKILYEEYYGHHHSQSLLNSFSMSKAILSILTGCAINDGLLNSEDEYVSHFIPILNKNKFSRQLTFRHLMTMQAGMRWNEEYRHPFAENSEQYFTGDVTKQVLEVEFCQEPGKKYEYQSSAAQLLGYALSKVTGKTLSDYLSEKIWQPLGMEHYARWGTDDKGMEKAFCCLYATTRDFAKIGQLVLQGGHYNGSTIISPDYCQRLLSPTSENSAFCYSVWANDESEVPYRFFYGFLGQFVIMIPSHKMVIVKTGFCNNLEVDDLKRPLQVQLIVDEVLKTFSS